MKNQPLIAAYCPIDNYVKIDTYIQRNSDYFYNQIAQLSININQHINISKELNSHEITNDILFNFKNNSLRKFIIIFSGSIVRIKKIIEEIQTHHHVLFVYFPGIEWDNKIKTIYDLPLYGYYEFKNLLLNKEFE